MSRDEGQPSPEHFLSLIRAQRRGRLKIYLGFAAGVGKTYEMLQEGQRVSFDEEPDPRDPSRRRAVNVETVDE